MDDKLRATIREYVDRNGGSIAVFEAIAEHFGADKLQAFFDEVTAIETSKIPLTLEGVHALAKEVQMIEAMLESTAEKHRLN